MKLELTSKNLMNLGFIMWIITEFIFLHTIYSQLALLFFFGTVIIHILYNYLFPLSRIYLLYLLFYLACYLNITLGYSINPDESYKLMLTLGVNFIFFIFSYYYFYYQELDQILDIIKISAILVSFITWIVNYSLTRNFFLRGSGGINANGMAILDAFALTLLVIKGKASIRKNLGYILCLLLFCVISGTRKSFIIIFVMISVFYCFRYPKKLPKYLLMGTIGLGIALFLLMKIPFLYKSIGVRIEALILFAQGGEGDSSLATRASFISLGMMYFKESPIWGNGVNCFKTISGAYGTYSHNNYVELLFSVGLVGTLSYYLMYLCTMIKGMNNYIKTKAPGSVISIAIIISCIITDYAQVGYYDRSSLVFITLAMAMIGRSFSIRIIDSDTNN